MHIIIRIISIFLGLFIVVNGIWIVLTPPFGDEPLAYGIIAGGLVIPILVRFFAKLDEKREA